MDTEKTKKAGTISDQQNALADNVQGTIQIEKYANDNFSLFGYTLNQVLDDVILVEFQDVHDDTDGYVEKDGIIVPLNAVESMWRIAKIILTGPNCQFVKPGDIVTFPNDKGLKLSHVTVITEDNERKTIKNGTFINEQRIFGVCAPE